MLRLTLPTPTEDVWQLVLVDEVTGRHAFELVPVPIGPDTEDQVWSRLESELVPLVQLDLAKSQESYSGLRGTTILGSTRLADGSLRLRSGTDVMVIDMELAMVLRKALKAFMDGDDPSTDVIELTPYRSFISLSTMGIRLTVRVGRFSRSRLFPPHEDGLLWLSTKDREKIVAELFDEFKKIGPDETRDTYQIA